MALPGTRESDHATRALRHREYESGSVVTLFDMSSFLRSDSVTHHDSQAEARTYPRKMTQLPESSILFVERQLDAYRLVHGVEVQKKISEKGDDMKTPYLTTLLFVCGCALADDDLRSRFLAEVDSTTDIELVAFARRGPNIESFGRPRLEYIVGMLYSDDDHRAFISIGPVWQRFSHTNLGVFIEELSFAPTVLTAGKFHDKDMGGIVHFTTGVGVGWKPASESSLYVGIRLQHISNGGIHDHNPGMNALGLELIWVPEF